ncbi:unnamed protein product, partial [Meganyctiphanes norvegica]
MTQPLMDLGSEISHILTKYKTLGSVSFVGSTQFSSGKWVGVVLDEKKGKNNGSVQGKSYFQCEDGYGIFVRQSQLIVLDDDYDESEGGGGGESSPSTPSGTTTPGDKPKTSFRRLERKSSARGGQSSMKRKIEPTSLKRKSSNPVPQKPDRLRLPLGNNKSGTPRGDQDGRNSKESSPRTDMKKTSSFIETGFVESLTPQFTPGPPSGAMQTLEDKVAAMQTQQEMDNLRADLKDLNEKLETLIVKRAQDKEKLKEAEKLRLQLEQLQEFKSKIMEIQNALQKELKKAKDDARMAMEAKDTNITESEELLENVEMLTLDKEMAEEKAETLVLELDNAKEKIEELTLDLEILRTEMQGAGAGGEGGVSSIQVKQLEQQNSRLRETLVKMRDLSAHDKHELQKLQKEMETKNDEIKELSTSKDNQEKIKEELEQTIADLQEQVDAALGAEEMVESLTDRNLNLEERVQELLETVADLEAINDMNDQLQENARELELELREELDLAHSKCRETLRDREALNEVIVDQDATIKKFRELVQKQQEQNLDLRHSLEKETNKPLATPSEIIDFKKMFTETKAHSKAIDMELRQLEVSQANGHVSLLIQYMPDNFMMRGGDHDAVLVLLLVPRMIWKAEIVVGGLRDKYPQPETIDRSSVMKSHGVEQYAAAARLLQLFYTLQALLHQYEYVLGSTSVDNFLKLGTLYPEMAGHERSVDFYIDLLRKDQLDENIPTDALEKTVAYFQSVYPAHLATAKMDQTLYLTDTSKMLAAAADATYTYSQAIIAMLHPQHDTSEVGLVCKDIVSMSKEVQSNVKRIRRRMPQDGSVGPLCYPQDVQDTLTQSMTHMNNAARALKQVFKAALQQTSLLTETESGIPSDKLSELIHQATDLIYTSEDLGPESVRLSVHRTNNDLNRIANTLEKGEYDFDGTVEEKTEKPVILRGQARKNEMKDTEHLKYKLESKDQDIKDLKLTLKLKLEEYSEMTVRRDVAEKKLSTATRDADITIEKLQRKLDDALMMLRRKEKEFEETMDHLQHDIESLENEKGELRDKLKSMNKKTLYEALAKSSPLGAMSPSSPTTPGMSAPANAGVVRDSPMLLQQIADLRIALSHATAAKHDSTASRMHRQLAALKPIKVIGAIDGEEKRDVSKEETEAAINTAKESADHLSELTRKAQHLRKDVAQLLAGVEVVDISKRRPATLPSTDSAAPIHHLVNHRNKVNTIKMKISDLQNEITRTIAARKPGGSVVSSFSTFPTPQLTKALGEQQLVKIGRVQVPSRVGQAADTKDSEPIPVVLEPESLKMLHMRLLA